jgi:hypothetical protein
MEQDYATQKSRNPARAVAGKLKSGAPIGGGGNQNQGKGELPAKVSVPMPGTNQTQPAYKGGMKQNVPGFGGGVIEGKIKV